MLGFRWGTQRWSTGKRRGIVQRPATVEGLRVACPSYRSSSLLAHPRTPPPFAPNFLFYFSTILHNFTPFNYPFVIILFLHASNFICPQFHIVHPLRNHLIFTPFTCTSSYTGTYDHQNIKTQSQLCIKTKGYSLVFLQEFWTISCRKC